MLEMWSMCVCVWGGREAEPFAVKFGQGLILKHECYVISRVGPTDRLIGLAVEKLWIPLPSIKIHFLGTFAFTQTPTKSLKLLKSLIRGRGRIHKIFITTNLAITWSCESQNANMDQRFLSNKGILQTDMPFRSGTFELSPCVIGQLPVTIENREKRKGKKVRNDWGPSVRSKKVPKSMNFSDCLCNTLPLNVPTMEFLCSSAGCSRTF